MRAELCEPLMETEPPVRGHWVRLAMSVVSLTLAPGGCERVVVVYLRLGRDIDGSMKSGMGLSGTELWEKRTREDPLACWLLERVTAPCRCEELVVRRGATCKSSEGEECAGEHCE